MVIRNARRKKPQVSAVELAIAAIEGRPNPLDDAEMARVNPDRVSLDLPVGDGRLAGGVRVDTLRSRPSGDVCIICGQSPSDDCR